MKKTYQLSAQIWALLACATYEWRLCTYGRLAKVLGMQGASMPGQKKTYKLAVKVWGLLTRAARARRSYTYTDLVNVLGMDVGSMSPLRMANLLEPIMHYCNQKGFPPLTVLVVNRETGLPGPGLKPEGRYKNKDMNWNRERVFEKDWFIIKQPKESDFQKATESAKL